MDQGIAPPTGQQGADPIRANIAAVARLERAATLAQTMAHRLAATIIRTAGSGQVILLHALCFLVWIPLNLGLFGGLAPFDPYPFSLLTMIVSLEVIFLTLFVLLNQNNMTAQANKRAHLDLQVSLLAEREMTLILRMLKELSHHLGVTNASTRELEELLKDTDVASLAAKLDVALRDT